MEVAVQRLELGATSVSGRRSPSGPSDDLDGEVWSSARPSPGEARKLALALALHREVWLMLLDEPSNHLDLPSVERLEAALVGVGCAFVLVTHDAQLAQATCRRVWRVEYDDSWHHIVVTWRAAS